MRHQEERESETESGANLGLTRKFKPISVHQTRANSKHLPKK